MWDLLCKKWHWGRFSPSTSVSPAEHSSDCSILIIILGWYNRPLVVSVVVNSVPLDPKKEERSTFFLLLSVFANVCASVAKYPSAACFFRKIFPEKYVCDDISIEVSMLAISWE
jgi:hypothetical protein